MKWDVLERYLVVDIAVNGTVEPEIRHRVCEGITLCIE